MNLQGVMVPLVTPFKNGKVDYESYRNIIDHCIEEGVSGIIPLATTGESPTISEYEYEEILSKTIEYTKKKVSIYTGLGGNNTIEVANKLKKLESMILMEYYLLRHIIQDLIKRDCTSILDVYQNQQI